MSLLQSKEKQVQRIRNLFFRQLSVPLSEMSSTLLTYKAWEAEQGSVVDNDPSSLDGLPPHIASAYQKALEMLKLRTNFEEQIAQKEDASDSERLQEFMVCMYCLVICTCPKSITILTVEPLKSPYYFCI